MNKFITVKTKAGWVIQNSQTYVVVQLCTSESEAKRIAAKLNS